MQPAPSTSLAPPPIPAMPQLSEKPHQGFATKKTALHPASSVPNFRVTLGLRAVVVENGVREIYSARYYNPNTGRFMSLDPEDGKIKNPASLHKYLYAGGDPVNAMDPRGREAMFEWYTTLQTDARASAGNLAAARFFVAGSYCTIMAVISSIGTNPWNGTGDPIPWGWTAACTAYAVAQGVQAYLLLMAL